MSRLYNYKLGSVGLACIVLSFPFFPLSFFFEKLVWEIDGSIISSILQVSRENICLWNCALQRGQRSILENIRVIISLIFFYRCHEAGDVTALAATRGHVHIVLWNRPTSINADVLITRVHKAREPTGKSRRAEQYFFHLQQCTIRSTSKYDCIAKCYLSCQVDSTRWNYIVFWLHMSLHCWSFVQLKLPLFLQFQYSTQLKTRNPTLRE